MQDLPRTKQKIEKDELKSVAAALWAAGIDAKVFTDVQGGFYLAVKIKPNEAPHVFREVESKEAAKNCGAAASGPDSSLNSINFWKQVWDDGER
jgi:hypothetical protein